MVWSLLVAGSCSSSSPSISWSVIAKKGGGDDLDRCSMRIQTCSSILGLRLALEAAVGFSTALVLGCTARGDAWEALLLVRLSTWVVIAAKADVKGP